MKDTAWERKTAWQGPKYVVKGWVHPWAFTTVINSWEKLCFWHFWSLDDVDKPERGQRKAQRMIKRLKTVQHLDSLQGLDRFSLPKTGVQGAVTTVCKNVQED